MTPLLPARPQDVPELREHVAALLESIPSYFTERLEIDEPLRVTLQYTLGSIDGLGDGVGEVVANLYASTLRSADLFHVSDTMVDVAEAAAQSLPEFSLEKEDMPSPSGFLVFGRPIPGREVTGCGCENYAIDVVAASWCTVKNSVEDFESVLTTWWWDSDIIAAHEVSHGRLTPAEAARWRKQVGALSMATTNFWPLSLPPVEANRHLMRLSILKTIWLFMQQELAVAEPVHYDRAMRRRAAREQRELPPVRIITLRRARHSQHEGEHGNREYHHRWLVRGHWRQQWFRTRQVHRPVWIAPHIKGPEDAPLLGGEKVYALRK